MTKRVSGKLTALRFIKDSISSRMFSVYVRKLATVDSLYKFKNGNVFLANTKSTEKTVSADSNRSVRFKEVGRSGRFFCKRPCRYGFNFKDRTGLAELAVTNWRTNTAVKRDNNLLYLLSFGETSLAGANVNIVIIGDATDGTTKQVL